jgi:outer membrane protein assembly factor BamE
MKSKTIISLIFCSLIFSTGCAYRADLPQGNFTEQKDVFKLRKGMTQEQVKFVLGTPMLLDPLETKNWYYVKFLRHSWEEPEIQRLIVIFDNNNLLEDIRGDFKKSDDFYTPL